MHLMKIKGRDFYLQNITAALKYIMSVHLNGTSHDETISRNEREFGLHEII